MRAADAFCFDPQNRAAEPTAQLGGVVGRRPILYQRNRHAAQLFNVLRAADELFGEVGAVLKQVQSCRDYFWRGVEALQSSGVLGEPLQKILERAVAALEIGARDRGGQNGRALLQSLNHEGRAPAAAWGRLLW